MPDPVSNQDADPYAKPAPLSILLGLAVTVGPLGHYMLSALGPVVIEELGLSRAQFGGFWAITFAVAALLTVYSGRLTDRYGPRPAVIAVLVVGTAGLVVLGAASTYWLVVVGLALAGCAQSASNAATNSAVAAYVHPSKRGLVVGAKQSGVQLGQFTVGLLAPAASIWLGWRTGFFGLAVLGAAGLAFALRLPRRDAASRTGRPQATGRRMTLALCSLIAYAFGTGFVVQAANVYLPLFAFEKHGLTAHTAGLVTAALGGVGVVARLAWGRYLDRIPSLAALRSMLSLVTAVSILLIWGSLGLGAAWMWVGIAVFSSTAMVATVVLMLEVVRGLPDRIGYASGYVSLGLMGGFMVGPLLFGYVVDATTSYSWAWLLLFAVTVVQLVVNVAAGRVQRSRSRGDAVAVS